MSHPAGPLTGLETYLATVMKEQRAGNTYWAGDGLPPYAQRLFRTSITTGAC